MVLLDPIIEKTFVVHRNQDVMGGGGESLETVEARSVFGTGSDVADACGCGDAGAGINHYVFTRLNQNCHLLNLEDQGTSRVFENGGGF